MGLFREMSLEKIASPEHIDEYIKVTTPSVWIVLIALLAGILFWCIFGTMRVHDADGNVQEVHPIIYVTN